MEIEYFNIKVKSWERLQGILRVIMVISRLLQHAIRASTLVTITNKKELLSTEEALTLKHPTVQILEQQGTDTEAVQIKWSRRKMRALAVDQMQRV
jgi:hypothetical protein